MLSDEQMMLLIKIKNDILYIAKNWSKENKREFADIVSLWLIVHLTPTPEKEE